MNDEFRYVEERKEKSKKKMLVEGCLLDDNFWESLGEKNWGKSKNINNLFMPVI